MAADDAVAAARENAALAATPGLRVRIGYGYGAMSLTLDGKDAGVPHASGVDIGAQYGVNVARAVDVGFALALHLPDGDLAGIGFRPATEPQFPLYEAPLQRTSFDLVAAVRLGPVWLGGGADVGVSVGGGGTHFDLGHDARGTVADGSVDVTLPYRVTPVVGARVDLGRVTVGASVRGPMSLDLGLGNTALVNIPANPLNGTTSVVVSGTNGWEPAVITAGAHVALTGWLAVMGSLEYAVYHAAPPPVADVQIDVQLGTTPGLREVRFIAPRFRDTLAPRLAAEIRWPSAAAWRWAARLGYAVLPSPVPRQSGFTTYADATRHQLAAGGGLHLGRLAGVDLAIEAAGQVHLLQPRSEDKDSPALPYAHFDVGGRILDASATLEAKWRRRALPSASSLTLLGLLGLLGLGACGLAPAPSPTPAFPGDGVSGFGEASPIELCLGTAHVVSPDAATGAGSVCIGAGEAAAPCAGDAACSGIERCICGRCIVEGCAGGGTCSDGQVCAGQRCTTSCTADGDCAAGETCDAGGCARPCSSSDQCHHGERCDALGNVCVTKLCSAAQPCAPGDTCEAEAVTGYLHEPELLTVAGADLAYVELRDGDPGGLSSIYRARIESGGRWTADPVDPVLAASMGQSVGAPSTLVDGDTVQMFYALGDGQAIARAVSTDGGITFTPDAAPVLVPAAAWEQGFVGSPAVVRFQGATLLFYEGGPRAGVGLARLGDGGAVRVGSGPVVTPASATDPILWRDVTQVGAPYALVAGDALRVYFTGRGVEGSDAVSGTTAIPADPNDSIGMVASLDGSTFDPYPTGPVLARVTNLRTYLGEREAAVQLLAGGGAAITFVSTDAAGTSESGLAQAGP